MNIRTRMVIAFMTTFLVGVCTADEEAYVVKLGDTLSGISLETYGDGEAWRCLLRANRAVKDADLIYPGMSLVLPSDCGVGKFRYEPGEPIRAVADERRESKLLVSKSNGDVILYRDGEFYSIPIKMLFDELKERHVSSKRLPEGVILDPVLFENLMPKDPRLVFIREGEK